jgi:hypothetical protein
LPNIFFEKTRGRERGGYLTLSGNLQKTCSSSRKQGGIWSAPNLNFQKEKKKNSKSELKKVEFFI